MKACCALGCVLVYFSLLFVERVGEKKTKKDKDNDKHIFNIVLCVMKKQQIQSKKKNRCNIKFMV